MRSLSDPLGAADDAPPLTVDREGGSLAAIARRGAIAVAVRNYYIAGADAADGRTVRLDVVFEQDPFTRGSIDRLRNLKAAVRESLPPALRDAKVAALGATASLSDLAAVTGRDQVRINVFALLGVYAVLVLLLRRLALAAYLIATVALGYLTTLGGVVALFHLLALGGPARRAGSRGSTGRCPRCCSQFWWRWGRTTTSTSSPAWTRKPPGPGVAGSRRGRRRACGRG